MGNPDILPVITKKPTKARYFNDVDENLCKVIYKIDEDGNLLMFECFLKGNPAGNNWKIRMTAKYPSAAVPGQYDTEILYPFGSKGYNFNYAHIPYYTFDTAMI